jgi:uncharacterized protein
LAGKVPGAICARPAKRRPSDKKEQDVGKRGFSSMDPQKQREIASKGGKAAHQKGTAHEFTSEEARVAGRKGGAASRAKRSQGGGEGTESPPPPGQAREPMADEPMFGENSETPV